MSDTEKLIVELGIKNSNVNKEISAINRELKNLDKEVKSADKTTEKYGQTNDTLKSKLSNLEKMYSLNSKKLEDYKKKMSETTDAIKKQEEKIAKMKLQGQDTAKAEEQLNRMKQSMSNLGHQATITENDIKKFENEINSTNNTLKNQSIDAYKQKMNELGTHLQQTGEKFKNVGGSLNGLGDNVLKATAPLIAFGAIGVKSGMDFEAQMSRVKAISGATGGEFEDLKNQAIDLGATTAFSAKESAIGMENLASAGFKTNEIMSAMPGVLDATASSGEELGSVSNIMAGAIRGFGLEADKAGHVADVLAKASADTNADITNMGTAFSYVAPLARNVGWDMESVASAVGAMADASIDGSTAGTTLRGAISRLAKPSKASAETMQALGFSAFDSSGKMKPLSTIVDELSKKTANLTDEQKQNAITSIFGQEAMSGMMVLMQKGKPALDSLADGLRHCDGSAKEMAKTMQDNAKSKIDEMMGSIETAGIKLEQSLAPAITDIANKVGTMADGFANLTPETQQTIVKTLALTVAFGGLLKVTGGLTTGVGSIINLFGKASIKLGEMKKASAAAKDIELLANASKAGAVGVTGLSSALIPIGATLAVAGAGVYAYNKEQEAMTQKCTTSREQMGLLKTTLLELNGVHVESQEELEKSGVKLKELGDNLGEDFKNKVNESTESMQEFSLYLSEINMDNVLTESETAGFNERVEKTFTTAIESIKNKQATAQTEMGKMFMINDNTIDESEKKVLEYLDKNYNTNIEEATKLKDEVNKIYAKAVEEKRPLNEQEISDIQTKVSRIKEIELQALANNQEEQLFAKNEFKNRINTIDAESAKELLVQKKQELEEQNAQTLASYDTQVEMMKVAKQKAIDEGNQQDADNIQKTIETKEQEKQALLQKQQETWQGYLDIVTTKNEELKGKINTYTGEILTNADLRAQDGLNLAQAHYDGLGVVTQNGWYKVKDTTTGAMNDCYVTVDDNTGKITGVWNQTTGLVGGYTEEMKNKVRELGLEHETDRVQVQAAMGAISQAHLDSKNQVVGANNEVIGSLKNVEEGTGGVKKGILDVNGTPLQIETNADGTITKIGQVKDSVDSLPSNKKITITTFFEKVGEFFGIGQNATGTNNFQGGLSTVDENNKWELASNNNVRMLGSFGGDPLAYIPRGTGIRTNMQSISDMKAEISRQLNNKSNSELVKVLELLTKLQVENNKNQIKESDENYKKHKENKDYQKGILLNGKFLSKEVIKEMQKIQKDTGGLKIDNSYYNNKALKLLEAKQYSDGHIVTKEEEKKMKNGLMIGQTYYDKETLKKMRVYSNEGRGIWIEGKFVSDDNVKEMQRNQLKKLRAVKLEGEYYNINTKKSNDLIENYKYSNKEVDYKKISDNVGKQIGETIKEILQGLGIEINVTNKLNSKEISNELTDTVINKLGRIDRTSKVAKGR